MRLLIDLQGAQSESRFRGIGRYSLSLVKAVTAITTPDDQVELLMNMRLQDSIPSLRVQASRAAESRAISPT